MKNEVFRRYSHNLYKMLQCRPNRRLSDMKIQNIVSVFALVSMTACDPVTIAVGGAVAAGTVAVRDKEGVSGEFSDAYLKKKVQLALVKKDKNLSDRVELIVKHGIVVVIGSFDDQSQCARTMEIVRQVAPDAYDETKVQKKTDVSMFTSDAGITTRINSSLTTDGNVASFNYEVVTVNSIVYIAGTASTIFERDVVLNIARTTSSVEKVVSYIKIAPPKKED